MGDKILLYEGKAKKVYQLDHDKVFIEFKNSLTAFNALKKGEFEGKGRINRDIAAVLFKKLAAKGVASHYLESSGDSAMIAKKVSIIPLEVVVRNILAGSTAKKFGIEEGKVLAQPLVEFYFKNDELADPFMSDDQILMLQIATLEEINLLKKTALQVNAELKSIFAQTQIELVDFKIEFGRDMGGQIVLADEITPDCCRLWDKSSGEKLDKDRFRRDLGKIKESYEEVLRRLSLLK